MKRRWLVPLGIACTLAGCTSPGPAPTPTPIRLATYSGREVAFTYPAEWQPHYYPEDFDEGHLVTFLSTQGVHDPCRRHPPGSLSCTWPVSRLDAGGVLVEWGTVELPGAGLTHPAGARLITVTGGHASVVVTSPGACATVGAQFTVTVSVVLSPPGGVLEMTACLNGPNLAEHEAEVMAMVQSTTVPSPAK
ncbi:MAG: hypothetical protein NVSMB29_19310 [Candidatus Dormibacteria bacterium]